MSIPISSLYLSKASIKSWSMLSSDCMKKSYITLLYEKNKTFISRFLKIVPIWKIRLPQSTKLFNLKQKPNPKPSFPWTVHISEVFVEGVWQKKYQISAKLITQAVEIIFLENFFFYFLICIISWFVTLISDKWIKRNFPYFLSTTLRPSNM